MKRWSWQPRTATTSGPADDHGVLRWRLDHTAALTPALLSKPWSSTGSNERAAPAWRSPMQAPCPIRLEARQPRAKSDSQAGQPDSAWEAPSQAARWPRAPARAELAAGGVDFRTPSTGRARPTAGLKAEQKPSRNPAQTPPAAELGPRTQRALFPRSSLPNPPKPATARARPETCEPVCRFLEQAGGGRVQQRQSELQVPRKS